MKLKGHLSKENHKALRRLMGANYQLTNLKLIILCTSKIYEFKNLFKIKILHRIMILFILLSICLFL